MNVSVFKSSGDLIARFEIERPEDLPEKLQALLASGTRIPLRSRVQVAERSWIITGFEPFHLHEEAPRPDRSAAAAPIIEAQWRRQDSRSGRSTARSQMMIGLCWCVGGVIVTIGSYMAAANGTGSGSYVVAWGAIIFGGFRFMQGLVSSRDR